jgi:hypothetical protein
MVAPSGRFLATPNVGSGFAAWKERRKLRALIGDTGTEILNTVGRAQF